MKIEVKKSAVWLFGILFLADHCLYILNGNMQNIANELCWILCVCIFALFFLNKMGTIFDSKFYSYGKMIAFLYVLGVLSSIQAMRLHGQSLAQGLLPQRFVLGGFALYFIIMYLNNNRHSFLDIVEKTFCFLGYVEMFLYIVQYLVIDKIIFLNMQISNRLGGVRLNLGAIAIPYIIFKSINNMYIKKKIEFKDLILFILGVYYTVVVSKTRSALAAYIIAFICGFLLMRRNVRKSIVLIVLVIFIGALTQTELYEFFIQGLAGKDLSSQTRELGRAYYISKVLEHPLLGAGYINTNNAAAVSYAGINSIDIGIIAWVDLGFYGIAFFFGIIGLIWFIFLYGKMTIQAYRIGKKGNLIYWMYMIYLIVLSPNGTSFIWYISNTISFVFILCMLEGTHKGLLKDSCMEVTDRI